MSNIAMHVEAVQQRIVAAAQRVGRPHAEVTLVAVTKTHPLPVVQTLYQIGMYQFGENRVAESCQKIADMAAWWPHHGTQPPSWHFIGHVQTRQVAALLSAGFDLFHGVDRVKLAERFNRLAKEADYPPVNILLQCDISGEDSKSGFPLTRWSTDKQQYRAFLAQIEQIANLEKVTIRGLMTMAPFYHEPEMSRPIFKSLFQLREALQADLPHLDWSQLSMGMTNDYEIAIEEGATIVRVGRALFGERI